MTKNDLPWLKLATFGEMRTAKGALRCNANMIAINGVELDYDDGDLTWDQAWPRLYEARLAALLYTTRRHTLSRFATHIAAIAASRTGRACGSRLWCFEGHR
jgi:hypothetical protein